MEQYTIKLDFADLDKVLIFFTGIIHDITFNDKSVIIRTNINSRLYVHLTVFEWVQNLKEVGLFHYIKVESSKEAIEYTSNFEN